MMKFKSFGFFKPFDIIFYLLIFFQMLHYNYTSCIFGFSILYWQMWFHDFEFFTFCGENQTKFLIFLSIWSITIVWKKCCIFFIIIDIHNKMLDQTVAIYMTANHYLLCSLYVVVYFLLWLCEIYMFIIIK